MLNYMQHKDQLVAARAKIIDCPCCGAQQGKFCRSRPGSGWTKLAGFLAHEERFEAADGLVWNECVANDAKLRADPDYERKCLEAEIAELQALKDRRDRLAAEIAASKPK